MTVKNQSEILQMYEWGYIIKERSTGHINSYKRQIKSNVCRSFLNSLRRLCRRSRLKNHKITKNKRWEKRMCRNSIVRWVHLYKVLSFMLTFVRN